MINTVFKPLPVGGGYHEERGQALGYQLVPERLSKGGQRCDKEVPPYG